ncbi:MAG: cbb3-type cytochrome oxidase assembly protein CcoS [Mariprofundus sp.]
MSVIYGLIPGMIILGLVSVLVFFWAVKNGQYDDMEGPAHRILDDDDLVDHNTATPKKTDSTHQTGKIKHD